MARTYAPTRSWKLTAGLTVMTCAAVVTAVSITQLDFPTNAGAAVGLLALLSVLAHPGAVLYAFLAINAVSAQWIVDVPMAPPITAALALLPALVARQLLSTLVHGSRRRLDSPIQVALLLLVGWSLLSIVGAYLVGTTDVLIDLMQLYAVLQVLFMVVVYWLSYCHVAWHEEAERGPRALGVVIAVVLSSIPVMIWQYVLFAESGFTIGYRTRVFSSLLGPWLGSFYTVALSACLMLWYVAERRRGALSGVIISLLACLVIAFSRASLLALGALVLGVVFARRRRVFYLLVACCVVGVLIRGDLLASWVGLNLKYNIWDSGSSIGPVVSGTGSRIPIFMDALRIVACHPLFGIGMTRYADYSSVFTTTAIESGPNTTAHNDYLQIAAMTGIPGLVLYVLVLLAVGLRSWSSYAHGAGAQQVLGLGVFVGLLSYVVNGLGNSMFVYGTSWGWENMWHMQIGASYFWALVGVLDGVRARRGAGTSH